MPNPSRAFAVSSMSSIRCDSFVQRARGDFGSLLSLQHNVCVVVGMRGN